MRSMPRVVAVLFALLLGAVAARAAEPTWLLRAGSLQVGERPVLLGLAMKNRTPTGAEARAKAEEVLQRLRERLVLAAAAVRDGIGTEPALLAALEEFRSTHLVDLYLGEKVTTPARAAAKATAAGDAEVEAAAFKDNRQRLYREVVAAAMKEIPAEIDDAGIAAVVSGGTDDRVVARIAGKEVRAGQIRRDMSRVDHPSNTPESRERVARTVLESILAPIRFAVLAEREGYARRPDFIETVEDRRLRLLADRYAQLKIYPGVSVSEQAAAAYYERNRERLRRGQEREIFEILVADEGTAKTVAARLAGGLDFAAAAGEYSQSDTKQAGGRLGFLARGQAIAALDDAIAKLGAGELSPPIKTKYGWHILRCAQVVEGRVPPLTEVRAAIDPLVLQELHAAALAAELRRLEKEIPVEFNKSRFQEMLKSL